MLEDLKNELHSITSLYKLYNLSDLEYNTIKAASIVINDLYMVEKFESITKLSTGGRISERSQ